MMSELNLILIERIKYKVYLIKNTNIFCLVKEGDIYDLYNFPYQGETKIEIIKYSELLKPNYLFDLFSISLNLKMDEFLNNPYQFDFDKESIPSPNQYFIIENITNYKLIQDLKNIYNIELRFEYITLDKFLTREPTSLHIYDDQN